MYIPKDAGKKTAITVFLLPSLIGLIVFCLLPMIASLIISFMDYDLLRPLNTMEFVGFNNFIRILKSREFPQVLSHTFTYLILYLPVILVTSTIQALILNKNFRGNGLFRTIYYTPVITSWVAAAVVWQWVLSGKYGLLNNILLVFGIKGPAWLSSSTWAMPGIVLA
ncbi:MAG: sugar ABC transporter permease, partial [Christensenellaceae bacterium]|nr:sugar ABC transporter permease [Christensenellaceae bacterium]